MKNGWTRARAKRQAAILKRLSKDKEFLEKQAKGRTDFNTKNQERQSELMKRLNTDSDFHIKKCEGIKYYHAERRGGYVPEGREEEYQILRDKVGAKEAIRLIIEDIKKAR